MDCKAKPEDWELQSQWASDCVPSCADARCLLELRARVEALEANSKPTPNPRQIRSSLVERVLVSDWIATRGCAKSSAYKWLGILGIRPRREVNRATGKVESWLTSSEASILTAYADALELGHRSTEASIKAWDSINAKLVYRVNDACLKVDAFDDPLEWSRAAIREVLAYLCEHELIGNYARQQIEQEVAL
jgi:hypothetical protein